MWKGQRVATSHQPWCWHRSSGWWEEAASEFSPQIRRLNLGWPSLLKSQLQAQVKEEGRT